MNPSLYFYYYIKPSIPRPLQIFLRRQIVRWQRALNTHSWPIDEKAGRTPDGWPGWPNGRRFAFVLSHDVETEKGLRNCHKLMELEERLGFRSSFNFVPERFKVPSSLRKDLLNRGFDIGVHGLKHDGKLFSSRKVFQERAIRINHYLKEWNSVGFRSPAMHHNLGWVHDLDIKYDASTFDTDPFEPQADGVSTIFPFWVQGDTNGGGYIELPYTLPQDFTLFVLMKEKTISTWRQKVDWIAEKGGMVLVNVHPDYMNFDHKRLGLEEYPVKYYMDFLEYVRNRYKVQYWHALPKEMAHFWKEKMVIKENPNLEIRNSKQIRD